MEIIFCVCGAPISTSQRATTSHSPVLNIRCEISAPRLPIPIKATLTLSFALTRGAAEAAFALGIQNEGIADTAEKAKACLKNERREIISDFIIFINSN